MTFRTEKGTELPLLSLQGREYLQVQHRLLWFREKYPDWSILTEFITLTQDSALAKATIYNQEGRMMATAHKREDRKDFADFHEKAETGAIGRALALVGCGTQFATELDEQRRIVDAPVVRTAKQRALRIEKSPTSSPEDVLAPLCCGQAMIVSKFDDTQWYCLKCKKKEQRV